MNSIHQPSNVDATNDDNQILMPPKAPKLRACAAPADFSSFNMNQVEQALSSYGMSQ